MIKWKNNQLSLEGQLIAYIIGFGLVISIIHLQSYQVHWLRYGSFAQIGFLISLLFTSIYVINMERKEINLGSKWLWIPLAIIAGIIIIRPFYALIINDTHWGMNVEWASAGYAIYLFALYIISRNRGIDILKVFSIAMVIIAFSVIILGVLNPGVKNGGLISYTNYDIATGFLVFGLLTSTIQKQWWLSTIAIIGLFFTGADEAIFTVGVLVCIIIIRKDFSKKLLLPVGTLILTLLICTPLGITQQLYFPTITKVAAAKEVIEATPVGIALDKIVPESITEPLSRIALVTQEEHSTNIILNNITNYRWAGNWKLSSLKPLGYGYNINFFYPEIQHNVPLIIIEQIGIIGVLAWLWVIGYGIIKTKYKYAWIGIAALSVFDHFIWTQAATWFWVLAGVSSSSNIDTDLIFKGE